MTLLLWSPELELGIAQVDCQHHKLVDLLNALDSGVKKGYSYHILGSILADLVRYTVYHFTFEERLMETHGLPMLGEHRAEHQRFATGVQEFKDRFDSRRTDVSTETLAFLRDWLSGHILGSDREFATAFLAVWDGARTEPCACRTGSL